MADTPIPDWRPTLKRRLTVTATVLLFWACAIVARLLYLQVYAHEDMLARAGKQQNRRLTLSAKRGDILDRKGRVLASSVDVESIYVVPSELGDPAVAIAAICDALQDCATSERADLVERVQRKKAFAYIRRRVSPEHAQRVAALRLAGVGFVKESRRFYPNRELGAHVLGYVGGDNDSGLGGVEKSYDRLIQGRPGTGLVQTDAKRRAFSRVETLPTEGAALELTIDAYLQHVMERELRIAVEENAAEGGSAVMMDPWTGEILALANWPTFNPNAFGPSTHAERKNRAAEDTYEPGSTFKVVTASAALEQKLLHPDDLIDVSGGRISVPGRKRVVSDTHDYGVLSFTDVIVKSSNVGAIKAGFKVGADRMSEYVERFGFGRRTSRDFPGETAGLVDKPNSLSALASMSMGYQIGVTPLQMVSAVSSVANGGDLIQPRVIRAVIKNGERVAVPKKVIGRTITKEVAAEMTTIMEQVVERGTAKAAQIDSYTIAGKTGTSAQAIKGGYSTTNYNASFVGFVPSRKPMFTLLVLIDAPHAKGHTGGVAAAPAFQRIADAALRYYGVPASLNAPPPLLIARREETHERPVATSTAASHVVTMPSATNGSRHVFPDLAGMSARDALRVLTQLGVSATLHGTGIVTVQQPAPGAPLETTGTATLWLNRQPRLRMVSTAAQP